MLNPRCIWLGPLLCAAATLAPAQQKPAPPPVRVNILNVCTPTEPEQKEMAAALARIPQRPRFGSDYEVARGHSTVPDASPSDWVRVRHEFPGDSPWLAAQFLFSVDSKENLETLVMIAREPKDVTQIALQDRVSTGTRPADVLAANTPVSRVSLERFGKPHLVLARCPDVDQSAYEPLFRRASQIMAAYRTRLRAKQIIPGELSRIGATPPKPSAQH